jgi:hypothetical protein
VHFGITFCIPIGLTYFIILIFCFSIHKIFCGCFLVPLLPISMCGASDPQLVIICRAELISLSLSLSLSTLFLLELIERERKRGTAKVFSHEIPEASADGH